MRLSSALMFLLRRHRRSTDSFLPNAFFSRRHLRLRVHVFTMPVHDAIHLRFTEDFSKKKKRKLLNARALFLPRFSPFPFLSSSLTLTLSLSLRACFSRRRDRGTKECRRKEGGASGLFLNSKKKVLRVSKCSFFLFASIGPTDDDDQQKSNHRRRDAMTQHQNQRGKKRSAR